MGVKYNYKDFEAIWDMAKHNIYAVLMEGMRLDEEGNLKDEFLLDIHKRRATGFALFFVAQFI